MKMNNPDFIVFGDGNFNTLGVLHELNVIKVNPLLLIVGTTREWKRGNVVGYSTFARRIIEVESTEKGYHWIQEHKADFAEGTVIYPTSDTAEMFLDRNYESLSKHFRFPNAKRTGEVSRLMDKNAQTALAQNAGIRILESQYTTSPDFSFARVKYPCMIKPINSTTGSKGDMRVCKDETELREALQSGLHTRDFVVQQYIEKEAELLFLGVSFKNGEVWLPAVVVKPQISPFGEYSHALVSTDVERYLPEMEKVRDFVRSTNYVGPFSIEFGVEHGIKYFFEINMRNDGISHYPLSAGVNIAEAFLKDHPLVVPKTEYEMIIETNDLRRVLYHEISLAQWYRSIRHAGAYRYYYKGDRGLIAPILLMTLQRILGKLFR
jgi:predicted ATP-grasp superfamily ATP-dependent carboligase